MAETEFVPNILRALSPVLVALVLGACASGGAPWPDGVAVCGELPAADNARLTMIRQALAEGRPHAALAYLDAAGTAAPAADLLRADALRQTGRADAAAQIYGRLRESCLAGYAHQGLGLIANRAGRFAEGAGHLRRAREALPTDAAIRGDYGQVLLQLGDTGEAVHEFLTALELDPSERRSALSLLGVLLQSSDEDKALRFARQAGLSAADVDAARARVDRSAAGWQDEGRAVLGPLPSPSPSPGLAREPRPPTGDRP